MWLLTSGCPATTNGRPWFHRKMVSGTSSLKALREEECLISSVPWKTNAERDLWYLKAIRTYVPASSGYFTGNKKCRFSNDADVSTETGSAVTI